MTQGTGHAAVQNVAISEADAAREKTELKTLVDSLEGWTEKEVKILKF